MKKTDFFKAIMERARILDSLYSGNIQDRQNIISFIEANDWFCQGVPHAENGMQDAISSGCLLMNSEKAGRLVDKISLWLEAYQRSNEEKLGVLAKLGERFLPWTTDSYVQYVKDVGQEKEPAAWKLLDYFLSHLGREICDMRPDEVDAFVSAMNREASLAACQIFGKYYEQAVPGDRKWIYRFDSRTHKDEITAYPVRDFACMMYCALNDENWLKESMIEKACGSAVFANLWAFVSMHFICALRATDIIRLPKPLLPCDGENFRKQILAGKIEKPELFCRDMRIRLEMKHLKPKKTAKTRHVPDLKVFFPVSLEKPFGIILSVAASFCDDIMAGQPFIRRDTNYMRTKCFFGEHFSKVLHGRDFSTRRANKSYLQGIEMVGDSREAAKPKGYMLASLARSHKGGIENLSSVTERYLKDNVFFGYSPQFIAREMFERGVFGFIPHLLLKSYKGEDYRTLRLEDQTSLIREVGIQPSVIEELVRINQRNLSRAQESISQALGKQGGIRDALLNIAHGKAVAKDEDSLCLMTACGFPCAENDRDGCVGCRYEIYTKALLHRIMGEYTRLKDHFTDPDGWRHKAIAEAIVMPMVGEFIETMKQACQKRDMDTFKEIMEGGLTGYACCGQSGGEPEL